MDYFLASADVVTVRGDRDAYPDTYPTAEVIATAATHQPDGAPGLVWRLDVAAVAPAALRADGRLVTGLAVWRSYADVRRHVLAAPRLTVPGVVRTERVLWWLRPGERPSVAEAIRRFERLRHDGPGDTAFTLRSPVPPPRISAARRVPQIRHFGRVSCNQRGKRTRGAAKVRSRGSVTAFRVRFDF